jgi:hypothetical protein
MSFEIGPFFVLAAFVLTFEEVAAVFTYTANDSALICGLAKWTFFQ